MNWKKFFIAFIASFIFIFVFGYLWWGLLMHSVHMEVPSLFRPEAEFGNYMPWLILGHIIMAFFLTCIYAKFVSSGGPGVGAKLGLKLGLFCAGIDFIGYAVHPMTSKMLWGWVAGDVLMLLIAGAIVGALYKPSTPVGGV
jgi:hypothetical protein